jgi:Amt family ammonium transporter
MHPSNLVMTLIGAGLLWVGWFGFNAGSSVGSGLSTAQALTATQVAAAAGGLGWILIEGFVHGKATSLGMASGILAGLVAITPAAGVVRPGGAIVLGLAASAICYGVILIKGRLGYDDTLDVFGIHGVAGIVGALLLTAFIRESWLAEAARASGGAWSAWQQLGVQCAGVAVTALYTAMVSLGLFVLVQKTFGLRIEEKGEMAGLDLALHGEHGYGLLNPS